MISPSELEQAVKDRELEGWEHRLACTIRGYATLQDQEWVQLENLLLRLSLDAATLDEEDLPLPDGRKDLAISLLSRALSNTAREAEYPTNYLMSLGAMVFASAANFPTACLMAGKALAGSNLAPFDRWAMTVLSDRSLKFVRDLTPPEMMQYAQAEQEAIQSGTEQAFSEANRLFYKGAEVWSQSFCQGDALLLLLWAKARRRFYALSASRILSPFSGLGRPYVDALLKTSSPLLYPTQAEAIERYDLLNPKQNALIILPTSTGKSLLGELAIVASLTDERPLGIYLAPYRALADQIYQRMRTRLADINVTCEARRGGYLGERPIDGTTRTVLVATPESFDAFLRIRPDLHDKIACCVFDEFHLVEQPVRGLCYEGLVGRMKAGSSVRIVSLSPVVSASKELLDWLRVDEGRVIKSAWRPTARRIAVARPDGVAHYFTPGDHLGEDPGGPSWIGEIPFPKWVEPPKRVYAHELREHDAAIALNVSTVAIDQHVRFQQPVLVLSSTREQTRTLAARIASKLEPLEHDHQARSLAAEIGRRCPYLFTLRSCLNHGVAYHNASLPNWIREGLEWLMARQELRIVTATTTLAEGVDLPFRVVVMADWRNWQFGAQRAMPTLLFRNIAGRCGRAGAFAEGDTIIVDNPGRRPGGEDYRQRYKEYIRLYVRPKPQQLESAVSQAIAAGDEKTLRELNAVLESQFVAFLDFAHPEEGSEERDFSSSLFSGRFEAANSHIDSVSRRFVEENLADSEFPVLQRNSPLAVTDFGRRVLVTGLSPRSGVALGRFLRSFSAPLDPMKGRALRKRHNIEWVPILAGLRDELKANKNFATELASGGFYRIGGHGFPIKEDNFLTVLLAWVSGLPIEEIAYLTIQSKELREASDAWLRKPEGVMPEGLESRIEQTAVFLNGYAAQQWSWVLRGTGVIAESMEQSDHNYLNLLAARIEHGVRFALSAKILSRNCPVDRSKVDHVVAAFGSEIKEPEPTSRAFMDWLDQGGDAAVMGQTIGFFGGAKIEDWEITQIVKTLRGSFGERD